MERVKPARGAEYRETTLRQTPGLLEHIGKFKESDSLGNPETVPYPDGLLSPTTWRYIKVLSDLQMLFGPLDGLHIAEIGVGYGGQCKIINDVFDVASYTTYDLEPVAMLADKFLKRAGSPVSAKLRHADFRRLGQDEPVSYDLVISNWALSECARDIQERYIEHVLRRARRGYVTYNQIAGLCGIDAYSTDDLVGALQFPVTRVPEQPGDHEVPEAYRHLQSFILHW